MLIIKICKNTLNDSDTIGIDKLRALQNEFWNSKLEIIPKIIPIIEPINDIIIPSNNTVKKTKNLGLPIANNIANSFILSKVVIKIVLVDATKAVLIEAIIITTCKLLSNAIKEY